MALPTLQLDDRTFDQLFAFLRKQIDTTEWVDRNYSDPGIALLDLLCWMGEMILLRADRIPPAHVERFASLLLDPPEPVTIPLTLTATLDAARVSDLAVLAKDAVRHRLRARSGYRNRAPVRVRDHHAGAVQGADDPARRPDADRRHDGTRVSGSDGRGAWRGGRHAEPGVAVPAGARRSRPAARSANARAAGFRQPFAGVRAERARDRGRHALGAEAVPPDRAVLHRSGGTRVEAALHGGSGRELRSASATIGSGQSPRRAPRSYLQAYRILQGPDALIPAADVLHQLDAVPGLAATESIAFTNGDAEGGDYFFPAGAESGSARVCAASAGPRG